MRNISSSVSQHLKTMLIPVYDKLAMMAAHYC